MNHIETNALYRKNHRLVRHLIYGSMSDKVFSTISSYKPSIEPYSNMTGEEYLTFISTFFAPVLERRWWRLEFEERRQGKDENVILYLSSKWSLFKRLYGETSQLHFDDFRRSCLKPFVANILQHCKNVWRFTPLRPEQEPWKDCKAVCFEMWNCLYFNVVKKNKGLNTKFSWVIWNV